MTKKDQVFELSRAGAETLKAELEKLKTVDRIQIREAIKEDRFLEFKAEFYKEYGLNNSDKDF